MVRMFFLNLGPALTYRHRSLIVSLCHTTQQHPLTIEALAPSYIRREYQDLLRARVLTTAPRQLRGRL